MPELFALEEIERILGIENQACGARAIASVSIDSRACSHDTLFIALKGERTNGALYLQQAFDQGASAALVEKGQDPYALVKQRELALQFKAAFFMVEDSMAALQALAAYHISRFPNLIRIGITGSSGKTTVKEMLAAILRCAGPTAATQGNLNSDSGLPLSCFAIAGSHKYAVLEMGMNRVGEIEELARILRPRYAAITNIGTAHIGPLGSQEAIAREKKAIFSQFDGGQTAFIPQNDTYAGYLAKGVKGKVIFYANETLKRFEKAENLGLDGWLIYMDGQKIRLRYSGKHNLQNACLAMYMAFELGLKIPDMKKGLENIAPAAGRNEIIRGRITLVKDSYNANPESMRAALASIAKLRYRRKVAFLAEMAELGSDSEAEHAGLAPAVVAAGLDAVYLLGPAMFSLAAALKGLGYSGLLKQSASFQQLAEEAAGYLKEGDLLLLKGSRKYALERLEKPLQDRGLIWPELKKTEKERL